MIKITADSTCDLSQELIEKYNISIAPLHVLVDEDDYLDGVTITPNDLFRYVEEENKTCSTAAINTYEYETFFGQFTEEYDAIIHINLGMQFSSCFQNANIAAQSFSNVYIIDSENLSTGSGHVVLSAADFANEGLNAEEIVEKLKVDVIPKVKASFVIDKMDYLKRGGRCSSIEAFGATLLKIKPSIEVLSGKMEVGKKYRGNFKSCLEKYIKDRLSDLSAIDTSRIFITHCECDQELVDFVASVVAEYAQFDEVLFTKAGCTISSHCGPNTLGILYKTK